jgi:cation transport ATPase
VTDEVIANWEAALGNWLWLCPLFAIGLAAGVLMFWRLRVWTAIVAALGFLNPIIAAAALLLSSQSVIVNSVLLKRVKLVKS